MAGNFLDSLGTALNQNFGIGENSPPTLDLDRLPNIDRSEHRQYVDSGMIRNLRPSSLDILWQQPEMTFLVKKRQFSSLADNYRVHLMNDEERLYLKATKRLFYNKCRVIAAYERLTKIEKMVQSAGVLNDYALPLLFSSVDVINQMSPGLIGAETQSTLNTLRKVKNYSDINTESTWIRDESLPYGSELGDGTGVLELTLLTSASVTNSIKFMGGSGSFTLEDPYKLMVITVADIEKAIAEASGFFQHQFFNFTQVQLEESIENLKSVFRQMRFARRLKDFRFLISDQTLLFKKVRAIIDEIGTEIIFTFDGGFLGLGANVSIDQSAREGEQAMNEAEEDIFKQIIQNYYVLLGLQHSAKTSLKEFNSQTNFVRSKMMNEFNGYPIIQPMDVVHLFISSKTQKDDRIGRGLFTNFNPLNSLNQGVTQISQSLDDLSAAFGGGGPGQSALEVEKNSIVGPDFPNWLWLMMRNDITRQAAGTHVFAGIVESCPHEGSPGHYTLKVSAKDQSHYFSFGQVNLKPSVDVYDSALYDPLTPFKLDFDAASGLIKGDIPPLLDENVKLLNSQSVRLKSGRFRGSLADENSYKIMDAENFSTQLLRRKFNDPDGFVYRWKRGIGSLTLFGPPHNLGLRSEAVPTLTNNPFAGQDVMNVLSLLITGQPYNFNNFLKAAVNSGSYQRDQTFNASYFRSLLNDLSKNNTTWGNFTPFKKMIINQSGYNFLRSGEFDISTANREVIDLLKERARRFDELTSILPQFANNPQFYKVGAGGQLTSDLESIGGLDLLSISNLTSDIIGLDAKIEQKTKSFADSLKNSNIRSQDGTLKIIGDDISFDASVAESALTPEEKTRQQLELRKKLNYLTQRRLWKIKSNEDPNLFIVDDAYDKNYDIQAFEKSLSSSLQTFRSTYSKVSEQIEAVSQMLGLEVFADSQGHLQARPPQYNRIPSSVLFDLINKKQSTGVQIFPKFLESLFFNQVQGLTDRIEIIEDEIRLRSAALGYTADGDIEVVLSGAVSGVGALTGVAFTFATSTDGKLGGRDLRNLLSQANPDLNEDLNRRALGELSNAIAGPASSAVNFDIIQRTQVVNKELLGGAESEIEDRIEEIRDRLAKKTGRAALTRQQLLPQDKTLAGAGRSQLDSLELTSQISQFLSERQHLIRLLTNSIKSLDQGLTLNQDPQIANSALFPSLLTKNEIPEILAHMIEDETYDDLGRNSGQRYIIRKSEVLSRTIEPTPPPFTIVEVDGSLETGLVSGPAGLEVGSGGNGISSAMAVDYDLWRQYGFRGFQAVNVPFLTDPEGQCAPYAVFLLNQARKNVLKGQVSRIGNEFTQAGEVYYLEDDGLLFYAESVTHSVIYGQSFTTQLNLIYGHSPGEFIPTMLDIIGKGLYSNKYSGNLIRHVRNSQANGDSHLGILATDSPSQASSSGDAAVISTANSDLEKLVQGSYGDQNRKNLTNLLSVTSELITPTKLGDQLKIEVRYYYNSKIGGFEEADESLGKLADSVATWLVSPVTNATSLNQGSSLLPQPGALNLSTDQVKVVAIDLGSDDEVKSPSGQAWAQARILVGAQNAPAVFADTEEAGEGRQELETVAMFTKILDLWATFESPAEDSVETSDLTNESLSEDQIAKRDQYIADFNKRLGLTENTADA